MFFAAKQGKPSCITRRNDLRTRVGLRYVLLHAILIVSLPVAFGQTTYYVASTGNDANNGQSVETPFQSIAKVNSLTLKPGDAILFRRGDTFRGMLNIRQSGVAGKPIVVDAYGSGNKPIISASTVVNNWTNVGANVWQASCPACQNRVTGVYQNALALPLGRYPNLNAPNKGYLTVQSHSGKTQLTSQQPLTTNWIGGEAVVRPVQWILDRATITQQNGNTLTLANNSGYDLTDGWGYFIQNHPATLDQTGEWYYNPANKTIRLYYDQGNPNDRFFTATAFNEAINVSNAAYITIRNLQLTQALNNCLYTVNTSDITLTNNDITNPGDNGVTIDGSGNNVLAENNLINDANNNGFVIKHYSNITFRGNRIRRIGLVPGRSGSGDGQCFAFHAAGTGASLIENNVLDSLGYNGITFTNNATIRRNIVSNYCLIKSDGGGIYTWNGNKQPMSNIRIQSNIVYNGLGAPEGAPNGSYSGANGIYLDDCTQNAEVSGNTVFDCYGLGIYLHATTSITLSGNTSYNNRESQIELGHNNGACPARSNLIQNNIFVSKLASQLVAKYESTDSDLTNYGSFDNNVYARPFDDQFKIRAVQKEGTNIVGNDLTLVEWQSKFSKDPTSKDSPLTFKPYTISSLSATNRLHNTFDGNNQGWGTWGPYNNGQAVWDNTGKLDGGSLRIGFPNASGKNDSYMIVTNGIGAIAKNKNYLLRFDAVASATGKKVQVFLRQQDGPYWDVSNRATVIVGTTRKSYEIAFTASADEAKAITVFQVTEDGKTVWLDNIRLRDATLTPAASSDSIRLVYNPTLKDSLVVLPGGFRDMRNQVYNRQVTLAPFSSLVLLKDASAVVTSQPGSRPASAVNLCLSLQTNKRFIKTGDVVSFAVRMHNNSTEAQTPVRAQWACRLPQNLEFVSGEGLTYENGMLTGTVHNLTQHSDTTFYFRAKPLSAGMYRTAAQVTLSTFEDPNSTPDSGTADGEDDSATVDFRVDQSNAEVFDSPNPKQKPLPVVAANVLATDPTKADLRLRIEVSNRVPVVNEVVKYTLILTNEGGATARAVRIQNLLPQGVKFVGGEGWSVDGDALYADLSELAVGATARVTFQARSISIGHWVNKAQINACNVLDLDSAPGNGFINGEDDEVQIDIRSR